MSAQLRPYQAAAIASILAAWVEHNAVLFVAATGAGKTIVFTKLLAQILRDDQRAMIIAHRRELIEQPMDRLAAVAPEWLSSSAWPRVGVVMADKNDVSRQLIIATVQSLTPKRLEAILAHGKIDYLITDECHHATADSYQRVFSALQAANPDLKHLGVTATPGRSDGDGLIKVYSHTAAQVLIPDLVKERYLVGLRGLAISVGISLKGINSSGGDFVPKQLAQRFDTAECRQVVVKAYLEHAANRRAIAFTVSVAGAYALAECFQSAGINAVAIDGKTSPADRSYILGEFRAGRIQIVCNCGVLTEGFDAPGTNCILMARPTKSDSLYTQCMGRGLRPANGIAMNGEDCLVLDFVPVENRNVLSLGDVLGVAKEFVKAAKEKADPEPGAVQLAFSYDGSEFFSDGTPLQIIARELRYLDASPFSWYRRDGYLSLGLGQCSDGLERTLIMTGSDSGILWGLTRKVDNEGQRGPWRVWKIAEGSATDLGELAHAIAQKWTMNASQALTLKTANWRVQAITDGQRKFLGRLSDMTDADLRKLSKGEAAQLITHYQARRAIAEVVR